MKEGEVEAAPTGSARSHGGPDVVVVPQTRPCRAADTRTCEVVGFVSRRDGKESGGGAGPFGDRSPGRRSARAGGCRGQVLGDRAGHRARGLRLIPISTASEHPGAESTHREAEGSGRLGKQYALLLT